MMINFKKILLERGESIRSIAGKLNIPESSLRRRLKAGSTTSLGRYRRTFSLKQEVDLADHYRSLDTRFFGLSLNKLLQLRYQFADLNKINHRFNNQINLAGYDWAASFLKRHNLLIRTPQKTSVARMMGFNRIQIGRFYSNLESIYQKFQFPPSSIFNMDETGMSTVPNQVPKVISTKGGGELVPAVCCFSSSGIYAPPLIFLRKRMKVEFLDGAPPETLGMISDTGFINTGLFIQWLVHFQKHTR